MRRWGYGLAGLFALVLFAGVASPEPATEETPSSSQTQTAEPIETAQSAEPTPSKEETQAEAVESSPTPSQTPTEPESETQTQTPEPSPTSTATPTPAQPAATPAPQDGDLAALLTQLVIEDEFPSGYDRDLFSHWIDADRDGCDARREVLILEAVVAPTVGEGCSLTGGSWYSAFDGVTTNDPGEFDIDHMVALKEAWDSGAHAWDSDRRRAFANDLDLPQALIAVSKSSNRSKGADDPAEWLPSLVSYHCQYIEDWLVVKIKWELSVDAREFNALRSVAAGC